MREMNDNSGYTSSDRANILLSQVRSLLGEKETYKDKYDLLHLHSRVASALALDLEFVPIIDEDIAKCTSVSNKALLERQREILASGVRWHWFWSDVKQYIHTWVDPRSSSHDIISAVKQYIEVLGKYFNWVSISWEPNTTRQCRECGTIIEGERACNVCGDRAQKNTDDDSPAREKRNTAGSVDNFMRCVNSVTVTRCESLPERVAAKLDEFAVSVGMYTGGEIRTMPLDEHGRRGPYMIGDLMDMLKAQGYTDYYPEKWWVAKHYWGWESQQISPLAKEEIKRDCSSVFSMYASDSKGGGSINREWLAVRILLNHRAKLIRPLSLCDFDIIKTGDILEGYEMRWRSFCDIHQSWNACPIYGRWDIDGR